MAAPAVSSARGVVATSQPLATRTGVEVLAAGGNAIDAAVAASAVLCVVEPMSIGLGGDLFALVHQSGRRAPLALNASGRSPASLTLRIIRTRLGSRGAMPVIGPLAITTPGLVSGWEELLRKLGSWGMGEVLAPAAAIAREGYAVTPRIADGWRRSVARARTTGCLGTDFLVGRVAHRSPRAGETVRLPGLARTLEEIGLRGGRGFYHGSIARRIVKAMDASGGWLSAEDLARHRASWVTPISVPYHGLDVYECPPSGQGIVALQILRIMEAAGVRRRMVDDPETIHLMVQAKKLAFADALAHLADPDFADVPVRRLLSLAHARRLLGRIGRRAAPPPPPQITPGGGTAYLCTADGEGNAVSLIGSLYQGFGSGIGVPGTGIVLQNRGALFSLEAGHPNCYEPRKRPFHTIIPAFAYRDGRPAVCFGVMGGHHQPQGQVQVLSNIIDLGLDAAGAVAAPRWHHDQGSDTLALESPFRRSTRAALARKGHRVVISPPNLTGGAQVIRFLSNGDAKTVLLEAGSDPRKDGCAMGV